MLQTGQQILLKFMLRGIIQTTAEENICGFQHGTPITHGIFGSLINENETPHQVKHHGIHTRISRKPCGVCDYFQSSWGMSMKKQKRNLILIIGFLIIMFLLGSGYFVTGMPTAEARFASCREWQICNPQLPYTDKCKILNTADANTFCGGITFEDYLSRRCKTTYLIYELDCITS